MRPWPAPQASVVALVQRTRVHRRRWGMAGLVLVVCAASAAAAVSPASPAVDAPEAARSASTDWQPPPFEQVRAAWQPSDAVLLDRHGEPLARKRLNLQVRRLDWVALDATSPALLRALLAAEDRRFAEHAGVDWAALAAAFWQQASPGGAPRGASSLSMQVAALLDPALARQGGPRSLAQKWAQVQAALALERRWSKAQILEVYLNHVFFRGELQGLAAASWGLFNKAPDGLDRHESALLAALLRAPNAPPAQVARRACALLAITHPYTQASAQAGKPVITSAAGTTAPAPCDADGLQLRLALATQAPQPTVSLAPHAAQRSLQHTGEQTSSLDAGVQRLALQALQAQLAVLADQGAEDAAAVVLHNRSGEVLAYVGSSGRFSRAAQVDAAMAPRQAGSTLKPFLYALAFDQHLLSPASLLDDSPLALPTEAGLYTPRNYDHRHAGPVSVRRALASSMNIPAVRALQLTGVQAFHQQLRALGLDSLVHEAPHYGPSLALGAADVNLLQLTNAYRTLANGGRYSAVRWHVAPDVPDAPVGQVLISPASAWLVGHILADNAARAGTFGFDSVLATPFWTAVKTGTSKDMRDNWCVGWSADYTVGVWVGNAAGTPMRAVSGVSGAAPAWADILRGLHRHRPSAAPPAPPGVLARAVVFEGVAEAGRTEWFQRSLAPPPGTGPAVVALAGTAGRPRITAPVDGSLLAWDPDIPAPLQGLLARASGPPAVQLEAAAGGPAWRWRLNDQDLPDTGTSARVPLPPGRHRLQLWDDQGQLLDSVQFEVRGALR